MNEDEVNEGTGETTGSREGLRKRERTPAEIAATWVTYTYDSNSNLMSIIDAKGNVKTFSQGEEIN